VSVARHVPLSWSRSDRAWILLIVTLVCLPLMLIDLSAAHAQQLGSLGPPLSSPGPLEQLVDELMNLKQRCIDESREAAGSVFIGLATIHLLWVAQQTLLRGGDVAGGVGAFVEQLIVMSLFAVVTQEGPQWGQDLIDFLRSLGQRISAAPYVPQTLFDMSVKLFVMNASVLSVGPSIMYAASMCLSCLIAGILFLAQLEATIVLSAGAIVLGFGGSVWTRFLATKYFQLALSSGLRLMLLEVLQGVSIKYLGDAMNVALQGGSSALEATATLVGGELFTVLLMLVLPLVFHALASGSISTSVEGTLARVPMMLAGGGMASAAMAAMRGAGGTRASAGGGMASGAEGSNAEQGAIAIAESGSPTTRAGVQGGPTPPNGRSDRSSAIGKSNAGTRDDKNTSSESDSARGLSSASSEQGGKPTPARSAPLPSSWRGSSSSRAARQSETARDLGSQQPREADGGTRQAEAEGTALNLSQHEQAGRHEASSFGTTADWQDLPTTPKTTVATGPQESGSSLRHSSDGPSHPNAGTASLSAYESGGTSAEAIASNQSMTANPRSGGRSSAEQPLAVRSVEGTESATALSGAPSATGHRPRAAAAAHRKAASVVANGSFEQSPPGHVHREGETREQASVGRDARPAGERTSQSRAAERERPRTAGDAHLSGVEAFLEVPGKGSES
jgi:type IV secretion system protein TrbL